MHWGRKYSSLTEGHAAGNGKAHPHSEHPEDFFTRVYRRFFTLFPTVPPGVVRYLAAADHDDHERLAALCGDEIVAVASWDRPAPGGDSAEIAILVEDAWQHRGLGRGLMRELTTGAVSHGITTLTATVLTENEPARRLARALARPRRVELDGPETHFTYWLAS